jgi:hypothetical protein
LCGPDGLQKNSIERSVPQAEGAWSVFGYFLLTKKYQWPAFGWVFAFAFKRNKTKSLEDAENLTNHFGDLIAA